MESTLVPIALFLGIFAMVFGLRYLTNKERMAMIERGLAPAQKRRSQPLQSLKWGLMICGAGAGLLIAFFITDYVLMTSDEHAPAIYFGMIALFGGLGLVISYTFEKREDEKERQTIINP